MNFQNLSKIESSQFYIDLALRNAENKVLTSKSLKMKDIITKIKYLERQRMNVVHGNITKQFMKILTSFPNIDDLPDFYRELVKCTLDYPQLKKSLGSLLWVVKRADAFHSDYLTRINRCQDRQMLAGIRREFYGRICSLLKQIKGSLEFIESARKIMKEYPHIKTSLPTIAVLGFPNVGKTTLLYKLTGSKPEIQDYAFTTKGINVAYFTMDNKKIQVIDTPGTLNRPNKMNNIEKQAYLAIKYCADVIVFVFDLTEAAYPLDDQKKLLKTVKKEGKPIIAYIAKGDILEKQAIDNFIQATSAVCDLHELKTLILKKLKGVNTEKKGLTPDTDMSE